MSCGEKGEELVKDYKQLLRPDPPSMAASQNGLMSLYRKGQEYILTVWLIVMDFSWWIERQWRDVCTD